MKRIRTKSKETFSATELGNQGYQGFHSEHTLKPFYDADQSQGRPRV